MGVNVVNNEWPRAAQGRYANYNNGENERRRGKGRILVVQLRSSYTTRGMSSGQTWGSRMHKGAM